MSIRPLAVTLLSAIAVCLVTYAAAEGIYSLYRWGDMEGSVAYRTYGWLKGSGSSDEQISQHDQATDDVPSYQRLTTRQQVESLIPQFVEEGVAIGDVPQKGIYKSLVNQA